MLTITAVYFLPFFTFINSCSPASISPIFRPPFVPSLWALVASDIGAHQPRNQGLRLARSISGLCFRRVGFLFLHAKVSATGSAAHL